jgi:hypothetical protein
MQLAMFNRIHQINQEQPYLHLPMKCPLTGFHQGKAPTVSAEAIAVNLALPWLLPDERMTFIRDVFETWDKVATKPKVCEDDPDRAILARLLGSALPCPITQRLQATLTPVGNGGKQELRVWCGPWHRIQCLPWGPHVDSMGWNLVLALHDSPSLVTPYVDEVIEPLFRRKETDPTGVTIYRYG